MDGGDLLGQEDFLFVEEGAEEEEPWWVSWWRQQQVVSLWVAVLLVTWTLVALSDWLRALPAAVACCRSLRSRRRLVPAGPTARLPPPAAAALEAAPAQPAPTAMATSPRRAPSPAALAPPAPQIVKAARNPAPPQRSDESVEERPEPLPPASIKHVNTLLSGRLWHEASLELLRLVSEPESSLVKNEEQARTLLSYHLKILQKRASPAVLAQIVVHVSEWLPDIDDRCALLQSMGRDLAGSDVATAVCQIRRAELLLQQENQKREEQQGAAAVDAALPLLVEVEERLVETAEVVPQEVSAYCYRLLAQCYSTKKDLTRYQDAALKYLCHVDPMTLPEEERKFLATELVVCSLLSEDINATAEMRLRPVLWALEESPSRGWLPALLEATDDGDVEAVRAAAPLLQREPRLERSQQLLEEKAATRALQAVCRSQRRLSMETAAAATQLSEDEAEQLVLRALARGAIDGHVDRSTLFVERVRPSPVGVLQLLPDIKKLDKWIENISEQDTRFAGQMESIISL